MRIIYMRVLFFIVTLFLNFAVYPSITVNNSNASVDSAAASFSFASMEAYLSLGPLSYGDISRKGLIATLSNPYRLEADFLPKAERPGRYSGHSGFVLTLGPVYLLASSDKRMLFSIAYDNEYFDAAVLYAGKNLDDGGFHESSLRRGVFETIYFAAEGRWRFFSLMGIASFSPEVGYSGTIGGRLYSGDYSISFIYGSPIALYADDEEYLWGMRGSIGEDGFYSEFSFSYGETPVFSEEYLPRSSRLYSVLEIGDIKLYSRMEHSFTARGNDSSDKEFGFAYGPFECGYSTSDGFYAALDFSYMTVGFRNGCPFVAFSYRFGFSDGDIDISLSSDGEFASSFRLR